MDQEKNQRLSFFFKERHIFCVSLKSLVSTEWSLLWFEKIDGLTFSDLYKDLFRCWTML
jgi:hypothetical protein